MSKIKTGHTKLTDLPFLVAIEKDRYKELYSENPKTDSEVGMLFSERLNVAGDWMWTAYQNKTPVGFLSAMPTSQAPDDFVSWEESTNNGKLVGKIDRRGKNVYVVNLDVSRSATPDNAQYMLMSQLASKVIKYNSEQVFFESRMPMFRDWVYKDENIGQEKWKKLSDAEKLKVAIDYSILRSEKSGKMRLYDRLLRFYDESGFKLVRVVPNAFNDGESLNFGMVCVAKNPLPKLLRMYPLRILISYMLSKIGNYPSLLERFIA